SEITQLASPQGTITAGYDSAGNRSSVSRGTGYTISYTFNDASHVSSLTNGFSETTSFTLDADARITQQTDGNGTKVLCSYDPGRGWLNSVTHQNSSGGTLAAYSYGRDAAGHISSETQTGDHTVTYSYDSAYQLTHEVRTGTSAYDISY